MLVADVESHHRDYTLGDFEENSAHLEGNLVIGVDKEVDWVAHQENSVGLEIQVVLVAEGILQVV